MRESRAPSFTAHPCVILAVDPGAKSGWAIFDRGRYVTSGVATRSLGRKVAIDSATDQAKMSGLPLVIVAEKWTAGGLHANPATMAGLGAAWGMWAEAIEEAGIPKARIVRVFPQTWRAAILQPRRGTKSEVLKAMSVVRAQAITGMADVNHDEADAVCIGLWATKAAVVAAKIPKRRRAA